MAIRVFLILALSMFSATLGIGVVSPLLPLYAKDMGATGIWLGIIVASFSISSGIVVPFTGRISDRRGRKLFLVVGLLVYSVVSLGYIWADNVPQLILVRLIQGVAQAMTIPIAMAYVADLSPEGEEGKWQAWASAAFFSGFGCGPLLGGVMNERFGMNAAFYTMGGFSLLAFLIALFLLPEARQRRARGSVSFKEMTSSNVVRGLFSFRLVEAIGRGGIMTFLPIFASMLGLGTSLIGVLMTINILAWMLVTPVGGMLADRFNKRTLVILGSFLFSILLVAIPLTKNFWQLLVVLLIQGLSAALYMPSAAALVVGEGKKYGMGSTMSMFFLAMSMGMALGPIISGVIADSLSVASVFYLGAALGFVGMSLFVWFTRQYQR